MAGGSIFLTSESGTFYFRQFQFFNPFFRAKPDDDDDDDDADDHNGQTENITTEETTQTIVSICQLQEALLPFVRQRRLVL